MTVAHDVTTNNQRTGTTDPHTFTHTPSGTPRAVTVFVINESSTATDHVVGITYGGQAMTRFTDAVDNAGEPSFISCYVLADGEGDTVPSGAQTVSVDLSSATADDLAIVCSTWTGSGPIKVVDFGGWGSDAANPRYTLQTHGLSSMGVCAFFTGTAAPILPANATNLASRDLGQLAWSVDRQTTASTSAFDFVYTAAADDAVMACVNLTDATWNAPTTGFYRKVGRKNAPSGTSVSGIYSRAISSGSHLLFVAVANGSRTFTNAGDATDTRASPDDQVAIGTNHSLAAFMVEQTQAKSRGTSWSLTISSSADTSVEVYEYIGLDTAGATPFDVSAEVANSVAQTDLTTALTATTAQADELLVGVAGVGNRFEVGFTVDVVSPVWNQRGQHLAGQTSQRTFRVFDRIVSSTGQYDFGGTVASSQVNGGLILTYKIAASGTLFTQGVSGGLTFSGSTVKRTGKSLTAGLSFTGSVTKLVSRLVTAGLTFSGSQTKRLARSFQAGLTFAGNLGVSRLIIRVLTATLSFGGGGGATTIVLQDLFGRTVSDDWGTPTSGNGGAGWTTTGAAFDVASGVGTISLGSADSEVALAENVSIVDTDLTWRFKFDKLSTDTHQLYFLGRWSTGGNYYRLGVRFHPSFGTDLVAGKVVAGSATLISSEIDITAREAEAADTWYVIRGRIIGSSPTTIQYKVWREDHAEPSSWDVDIQDSEAALQDAGGVGIIAETGGISNSPVVASFDDVLVTTFTPGSSTRTNQGESITTLTASSMPTHAIDDVLVAVVGWKANPSRTISTAPSGWTQVSSIENSTNDGYAQYRHLVYTKTAASASEGFSMVLSGATQWSEIHVHKLPPGAVAGTPATTDDRTFDTAADVPALTFSPGDIGQILTVVQTSRGDRGITPISGTDNSLGGNNQSWAPYFAMMSMWDQATGSASSTTATVTTGSDLSMTTRIGFSMASSGGGGQLTKRTGKALSGALTFAGAIPARIIAKLHQASLTFSGSLAKRSARLFTAGLSFAGSLTKLRDKLFTAGLTFSGSLQKRTSRSLTAALTFAGSLQKQTSRSLTAGLTFVGSLSRQVVKVVNLTATLTFAGSLAKRTGKLHVGSLAFSGAISRRVSRSFQAGLAFTGSLAKRTGKAVSSSLSFAGSLSRRIATTLTATLTFSGSLTRRIARAFTAGLSFVGNLAANKVGGPQLYTITLTAALTFGGVLSRAASLARTLTAALTFGGAIQKRTARGLSSGLTFTGTISRHIRHILAGSLSFTTALTRRIGRTLVATVSFSGILTPILRGISSIVGRITGRGQPAGPIGRSRGSSPRALPDDTIQGRSSSSSPRSRGRNAGPTSRR